MNKVMVYGDELDTFVSGNAMPSLSNIVPDEISECLDTYDAPDGLFLITDGWTMVYVLTSADFGEVPFDHYLSVETIHDVELLPGIPIYLAEYDGEWHYIKVAGI